MNSKGKKIMAAMKKEYGSKEGKNIFYASLNKGTISGVERRKSQEKAMKKMMK